MKAYILAQHDTEDTYSLCVISQADGNKIREYLDRNKMELESNFLLLETSILDADKHIGVKQSHRFWKNRMCIDIDGTGFSEWHQATNKKVAVLTGLGRTFRSNHPRPEIPPPAEMFLHVSSNHVKDRFGVEMIVCGSDPTKARTLYAEKKAWIMEDPIRACAEAERLRQLSQHAKGQLQYAHFDTRTVKKTPIILKLLEQMTQVPEITIL